MLPLAIERRVQFFPAPFGWSGKEQLGPALRRRGFFVSAPRPLGRGAGHFVK
jgi:hypothetical protein